jgi:hypothetical protein
MDASSENTVEFENLGERQQTAFLDALDSPVRFGPESRELDVYDSDLMSPSRGFDPDLRDKEFVRYRGAYYRLEFRESVTYTCRRIVVAEATPEPDDPVVEFGSLPTEVQRKIEGSIPGTYVADYGESAPEVLRGDDLIRYENETYETEERRISDGPSYELVVTRAEPPRTDRSSV